MKRSLITQQTANDEVHKMKNGIYAALHSKEAGFRQQAQSFVQQTLEPSEAATVLN